MRLPADDVQRVALTFVPCPVDVAEDLVKLKKENPELFSVRPWDRRWSGDRQMDHNNVATAFLHRLRGSKSTNLLRRGLFALKNKPELILTIQVLEQMAATARSSNDLFEFLHSQITAHTQMCQWTSKAHEKFVLSNLIVLSMCKVIFVLFVVDAKPCTGLVVPPPKGLAGTIQGVYQPNSAMVDEKTLPADATLPLHPEWMKVGVPIFAAQKFWNFEIRGWMGSMVPSVFPEMIGTSTTPTAFK